MNTIRRVLAALALIAVVMIPAVASAQVVIVRRPRTRTVIYNPPGPGVVVVRRRRAPGVVVVNPPGPGRVVVRRRRGW